MNNENKNEYLTQTPTPTPRKLTLIYGENDCYLKSVQSIDNSNISSTQFFHQSSLEQDEKNRSHVVNTYQSATLNMPTPRKPRKVTAATLNRLKSLKYEGCSQNRYINNEIIVNSMTKYQKQETEIRLMSDSSSSVRQLLDSSTATPILKRCDAIDSTNSSIYFNTPTFSKHKLIYENANENVHQSKIRREQSESRSLTKLARPTAPPPPPPPLLGFCNFKTTTTTTPRRIGTAISSTTASPTLSSTYSTNSQAKLIQNTNSFDYLGFENYSYNTKPVFSTNLASNSSEIKRHSMCKAALINIPSTDTTVTMKTTEKTKNFCKKIFQNIHLNKKPKLKCFSLNKNFVKFERISQRQLFNLLIILFSIIIFLACITFIISFQAHVHEFYKKVFNLNNTREFNTSNYENAKQDEQELTSQISNKQNIEESMIMASTQLINRTVLFCNSPYLSYQINNLIVLPFSLLLTIIFSFFSKRDSLCVNRCSGRPGIPAMINPFLKRNRFLNAALFCILANEVFKMLESSIFDNNLNNKNAKSFNTTADLVNFVANNLKNATDFNMGNNMNHIKYSASNSDFFAIGLGIKPNFLSNKQHSNRNITASLLTTTTSKSIMILGPVTMNYLKPRLPPRLDMSLIATTTTEKTTPATPFILDAIPGSLISDKHFKRFRIARNRSISYLQKINDTLTSLNDTSIEARFNSLGNMTPNELMRKTYEYTLKHYMPVLFKWSLIVDKLEHLLLIIIEVLIIGMRYYPLFGILDKNSLVCQLLATVYIWCDLIYNVFITGLCEGLKLNFNFNLIKNIQFAFFNYNFLNNFQTYMELNFASIKQEVNTQLNTNDDIQILNMQQQLQKQQEFLNMNLLFSLTRILYTTIKSLPHFFCLSYVTIRITVNLVMLTIERYKDIKLKFKNSKKKSNKNKIDYINYAKNFLNLKNTNTLQMPLIESTLHRLNKKYILTFEDRYVNCLFKKNQSEGMVKNNSLIDRIKQFIWPNDKHFRYSTRAICTYTVCFTLIYYLSCFLLFYSHMIIDLLMLNDAYKYTIVISIILTTFIIFIQLLVSCRKFRLHLITLYKGNKSEIHKHLNCKTSYSNQKLLVGSFNYAGYAVTYTCWGYLILFLFLTFIFMQIAAVYQFLQFNRSLASNNTMLNGNKNTIVSTISNTTTPIFVFVLIMLVPFLLSIFLIYLINKYMSKLAARFCFIQKKSKYFALKNPRLYSFFLYYKFFYDCFMGIASCLIRMLKSIIFGILFMSRLDYSFMGRSLERMDNAFMSYVGFLYWESYHTNPIVISFCQLLKKLIKYKSYNCENSKSITLTVTTNDMMKNKNSVLITNQNFVSSNSVSNYNRVVNRWKLYKMLIRNPKLIEYRKHRLIKK